jgi:hypothetical protein
VGGEGLKSVPGEIMRWGDIRSVIGEALRSVSGEDLISVSWEVWRTLSGEKLRPGTSWDFLSVVNGKIPKGLTSPT